MYGFAEARLRCHKYMPYVYHHVASLIPVERPGLGSLAVDVSVHFDAEWTQNRQVKPNSSSPIVPSKRKVRQKLPLTC